MGDFVYDFLTTRGIEILYKVTNDITYIYIYIYYMTVDDNTYYPMAIKIILARLWDNTFIRVIT